jgi:Guanine nucleotide exchange factor synembryn
MWNNLFEILKTPNTKIKLQALQVIRILTRDKTYLNETINEDQFEVLLDAALIGTHYHESSNEVQTEALKILCNLVFQSPKCQELCLKNTAVEGILKRLRTWKDQYVDYHIKFFDMKLLFLITALTPNVRIKIRDHHGLVYLVETISFLMMKNEQKKEFGEQEVNLINEILRALFNITVTEPTSVDEDDDNHLQRLAIVLHDLLLFDTKAKEATEEYHSNIVNLLNNIPISCYTELVPPSLSTDDESDVFENFNMRSINIFLKFLDLRLNKVFELSSAINYEQLPPILTVMIKCVRCTSIIRRYVRIKILPPLRDVKKRPEEGTSLRNHLCKLLTYPSSQISDLVAELLFVLCKENVGRMIKYTGYGNAAGLFAKHGLLGGRKKENQQQYSSDSEDSDTEEYKQLLHGKS